MYSQTFTLTFGDQAENNVGMEQIGKLAKEGFNIFDIFCAKEKYEELGCICELLCLNDYAGYDIQSSAVVLIVRDAISHMLTTDTTDDLYNEQDILKKDTKAKMYGRVCNKKARHNLCFSNYSQEPDYINGKGTVVNFTDVPLTMEIKDKLPLYIGEKAKDLQGEGNYYYNLKLCYIAFHGDAERKKVVAVRLGASLPLYYRWYMNGEQFGTEAKVVLNHGDLYIMSEKATGCDWKTWNIPTLRHAAGNHKFF
jgi:hypothetical protein